MNIASFNFWIVCAIPLLSLTSQTFLHLRIIILLFFCMLFSYSWKLNETFKRRVTQFCNQEKRLVNVAWGHLYVSCNTHYWLNNVLDMETFQSTSEIRYFKDEKPLVFHLRYWPEMFLRAFYTIWDRTNKLCKNTLSLSISHQLFRPINCRWINDTLKRKAGLKQFSSFQQFS